MIGVCTQVRFATVVRVAVAVGKSRATREPAFGRRAVAAHAVRRWRQSSPAQRCTQSNPDHRSRCHSHCHSGRGRCRSASAHPCSRRTRRFGNRCPPHRPRPTAHGFQQAPPPQSTIGLAAALQRRRVQPAAWQRTARASAVFAVLRDVAALRERTRRAASRRSPRPTRRCPPSSPAMQQRAHFRHRRSQTKSPGVAQVKRSRAHTPSQRQYARYTRELQLEHCGEKVLPARAHARRFYWSA